MKPTYEELQNIIAMQAEVLKIVDEYLTARVSNSGTVGRTIVLPKVKDALSNTQAAADAFMAEHDAKVLEGLADWFNAPEQDAWEIAEEIRAKATELRASTNRKDE